MKERDLERKFAEKEVFAARRRESEFYSRSRREVQTVKYEQC